MNFMQRDSMDMPKVVVRHRWYEEIPLLIRGVIVLLVMMLTMTQSLSQAGEQVARTVVVLGAEDDWAPYSSLKADKSGPEGFAPTLVQEVFASQGIEVKFSTLPFARCMYLTEIGQLTGCFDATILSDNREKFHWHATPMFHEELAIFGPKDGARTDLGIVDLEGKTVGVTLGYTYPVQFSKNSKIQKVSAKSDGILLRMLAAGRVDYVLVNTMPAYMRIKRDPSLQSRIGRVGSISKDGFWIAFSKSRPEGKQLAEIFERGLQEFKANGKYDAMQRKFESMFHE